MRWIAWLLVAACSGGSAAPSHPLPPPAARGTAAPTAAAPLAPSERECDELITHAVALGIREQASAEPRATEADHEAVRRELHDDFMAGCRALPRDAYRCAMAATELSALVACQPTFKSSTSNSSVAPGGMAPPAPRSP